jgi:hypothetical protein
MNIDKRILFGRPNNEKIFAAPAQTTGGLKGIIVGKFFELLYNNESILKIN